MCLLSALSSLADVSCGLGRYMSSEVSFSGGLQCFGYISDISLTNCSVTAELAVTMSGCRYGQQLGMSSTVSRQYPPRYSVETNSQNNILRTITPWIIAPRINPQEKMFLRRLQYLPMSQKKCIQQEFFCRSSFYLAKNTLINPASILQRILSSI